MGYGAYFSISLIKYSVMKVKEIRAMFSHFSDDDNFEFRLFNGARTGGRSYLPLSVKSYGGEGMQPITCYIELLPSQGKK